MSSSAPSSEPADGRSPGPDLRELDLPPEAVRFLLDEAGHRLVQFLEGLSDAPASYLPRELSAAMVAGFREPVPEEGRPLGGILDRIFGEALPPSLNTAGPGYLAYVPGGGLPSAAVAELIAAIVNRYAAVWQAAPLAAEIETQALRWLAELLGLPSGALGVFTTGGSLSNLLAFVAAREKILEGDLSRGTFYGSTEVHHSVTKAARIAGIPPQNARAIPVDGAFRMRPELLAEAIREDRRRGLRPFLVTGSAGTVNTGSIDPLATVARIARDEHLWFHVDGAYGGVFRLVPELAPAFQGMEEADSIAVDPHKGLFLAYGTGVLLVRDAADLRRAFSGSASYLPAFQEGSDRFDFCELSPELSRDWRGLRLWLPFQLHGADAFRRALREKRELALHAWRRLAEEPDIEIAAPPELSLFAFRQRFPGETLRRENQRNRELLEQINAAQRVFLTGTEIGARFYLRICVLHLRTHRDRLEEGVETIIEALQEGRRR